jgi:hypothetical protein
LINLPRSANCCLNWIQLSWHLHRWVSFNVILFFFCKKFLTRSLGYFIKYLDQININNAFVSGMYELLLCVLMWNFDIDSLCTGRKIWACTATNSTICKHAGPSDTLLEKFLAISYWHV